MNGRRSNNIVISVVVPVYNIQRYIMAFLNSLRLQTLPQHLFEVVLIDDASTDNTFVVAKAFQGIRNFTISRLGKHSGPGIARNKGIELSKGRYIFFLDGDDYLLNHSLQRLFILTINNNVDVVTFNWTYHNDLQRGSLMPRRRDLDNMPGGRVRLTRHYLGMNMDGSVIYTLVKKSLLIKNDIEFPLGFHEDMSVIFRIYYSAKKILRLNDVIYVKRNRKDSINNTFSKKHIEDYLDTWPRIMDFLIRSEGRSVKEKFRRDYLRGVSGLVATLITKNLNLNSKSFKKRCELYRHIVTKLRSDRYLDNFGMLPNITKKDRIVRLFLGSMLSKGSPLKKRIESFEKAISSF